MMDFVEHSLKGAILFTDFGREVVDDGVLALKFNKQCSVRHRFWGLKN